MPSYHTKITREIEEVHAAQRLRYEVFNVELGEGLKQSHETGRDEDPYDTQCSHLIVIDQDSGLLVGTYRFQTGLVARDGLGYYSANEFDFAPYESIRHEILELGRACIHRDHRKKHVLDLLWRGIVQYAVNVGCRYLIGCSSLTSQDPREGWGLYRKLEGRYLARPELQTSPIGQFHCDEPSGVPLSVRPPKLFAAYLAIGAVIAGPPALDREFLTIDFLTILDLDTMSPIAKRYLLSGKG